MHALLTVAILAALPGRASDAPPEVRLAIRGLDELARICEPDGLLLWRKSLCGPVVLVNPRTRAAIANRPDPDGKFRKEGEVFLGDFPQQFVPSNTSIRWGGEDWATVMLPLPTDPFQR